MIIKTLTFQRTNNCGAALQAFALYKYLTEQGHEVEIIDFCPKWVENSQLSLRRFKNTTMKDRLLFPLHFRRNQKFIKFSQKYCEYTRKVANIKSLENLECDALIVGSDQVWNNDITADADDAYLLNFKTNAKKIAYAASCGNDVISNNRLMYIAGRLMDYKNVSVREDSLGKSLGMVSDKQITTVCDPVFLLDAEDYRLLEKTKNESPYLLIYAMHSSEQLRKLASRVAEKYKLRIIDTSKAVKKWPADEALGDIGPLEFLGLIDKAEWVITNSFHGTAFSILFKKNFYALEAENRTSRINSLLARTGLQNRFVSNIEKLSAFDKINYNQIEDRISSLCMSGKEFLEDALRK